MEFGILLIPIAFIAGIITVFAPCVFTFLPIVLGASNVDVGAKYGKAIRVILALSVSVFVFTLLLRATTTLIKIPSSTWDYIAGGIIMIQGFLILFPNVWEFISLKLGLSRAGGALDKTQKVGGVWGDYLTGAALGPIFSSCSPTYGFIIGVMLQAGLTSGIIYLISYILGLALMLLAISIFGQKLIVKLKWGTNPNGVFKKIVGTVFVVIGLLIFTGIYKDLEAFIIQVLPFFDATRIDRMLLMRAQ